MQKDFILGVGCQKGATTWLRKQLNNHETCNFGFRKEYHVFDVLYKVDYVKKKNIKKNNLIYNFRSNLNKAYKYIFFHEYRRDLFLLDLNNYFDYFNSLFLNNQKLTTTGDITPSYSGLPLEAFRDIKENLEKRGFKVKVIFIMRDPIERIWSQARMLIKKYKSYNLGNSFSDFIPIINNLNPNNIENELVKFLYKDNRVIKRTRYEKTINNLEKIFDVDDIFYALYENLFDNETLDRLKDFLCLPNLIFDSEKIIHTNPKANKLELSDNLKKDIFNFYKDTYSLCDIRFNARSSWNYFA